MIKHIPRAVFVPFEYFNKKWVKRDDLPRFREPEEAAQFLLDNPTLGWRNGRPVFLQWQERDESYLVHEYMRGVGTPEYLKLQH